MRPDRANSSSMSKNTYEENRDGIKKVKCTKSRPSLSLELPVDENSFEDMSLTKEPLESIKSTLTPGSGLMFNP